MARKGGGGLLMAGNPNWCSICGMRIPTNQVNIVNPNHPLFLTIDHHKPRALGGSDHWKNRRPAHRLCNGAKKGEVAVPVLRIYELQAHVAALLGKVGIVIQSKDLRAARARLGIPAPGQVWSKGAPFMLARWEDDGGAPAPS